MRLKKKYVFGLGLLFFGKLFLESNNILELGRPLILAGLAALVSNKSITEACAKKSQEEKELIKKFMEQNRVVPQKTFIESMPVKHGGRVIPVKPDYSKPLSRYGILFAQDDDANIWFSVFATQDELYFESNWLVLSPLAGILYICSPSFELLGREKLTLSGASFSLNEPLRKKIFSEMEHVAEVDGLDFDKTEFFMKHAISLWSTAFFTEMELFDYLASVSQKHPIYILSRRLGEDRLVMREVFVAAFFMHATLWMKQFFVDPKNSWGAFYRSTRIYCEMTFTSMSLKDYQSNNKKRPNFVKTEEVNLLDASFSWLYNKA